ncbi:DUF5946 family protein [Deinococcus koreensis]|uniref:Uncharacterized protein n=1 Tax=Deinococcus koreensis TaxID=2054903 RepID=A0A2K3UUC6_9DEIO|nr:DUF5946 family protein [Deinococcus koreensis]PNY80144.1 hypothetical protein CVO96_01150 [Deinococcus koreensis]
MTPTAVPDVGTCEGCGAVLPVQDGPTHRYMASSAACWATFTGLSDPHRPLAGAAFDALIVDAYAAQHPGRPSPQTINSVAIHLMVLCGVLEHSFRPDQALWVRQRPGRPSRLPKHNRFHWLAPPAFTSILTVADVSRGETPARRSDLAEQWIREVWSTWAAAHRPQVENWFGRYVLSERV